MSSLLRLLIAGVLFLHGIVHLLGTAVYLKLTAIPEFPYKTTLLGGLWDLGPGGIRLFGLLWAVAAAGFLGAALALLLDWTEWRTLLLVVTLGSLALTILDWTVAYAGIAVNVLILAALFFTSQF
jgi:hypothetical protein